MACPRIVLDTNCLASALVFSRSRLSPLRTHWQSLRYIPLGCEESVNELIRVLAYPKFKLSKEEIEQLLADLLPFLETFQVHGAYEPIDGVNDLADTASIRLAQQAGADLLVSGDEAVLALHGKIPGLAVGKPDAFLRAFETTRKTKLVVRHNNQGTVVIKECRVSASGGS
ncbi:MAG: putative toxin-antitoxin system toxin component, PIN family [Deltaproteobacteria bacterium]|jgi:putative PIN family toxin of toxin-antitoxin system|nr:putative toxin-antitoxin system toxin component, PIN family [Deltaproteobacteria bacterium]